MAHAPDAGVHAGVADASGGARPLVALGVIAASGAAGLGCQIVWTEQASRWLGHESAAVLAVVAAFFGGLSIGALALGNRIERSARPQRWYAGCEATVAIWTAVLAVSMPAVGAWLVGITGPAPGPVRQWSIAFGATFALLLPATAAMGATLPAMAALAARWQGARVPVARLYAGNTAGATVGVLACAFVLVPAFGLARTAALCAALCAMCAASALWLGDGRGAGPQGGVAGRDHAPAIDTARGSGGRRVRLATLFATGLLGIGYEVLAVRMLAQVSENTVYTFAMLLAVYLVGTAAGAAAYVRVRASDVDAIGRGHATGVDDDRVRRVLLTITCAACAAGAAMLWVALPLRDAADAATSGFAGALLAEALPAAAVFLVPTVAMGALFAHLVTEARRAGIAPGLAFGANTAGAALAPLLFGVLLLPAAGPAASLACVTAGYLVLAGPRAWRMPATYATAAVLAAVAVAAPPLVLVDVPEGGRIVHHVDGATASVTVVEDAAGVATLHIDNRQQEGSSATRFFDARQAVLPALLHRAPRDALFLGLGTGVTAASAAAAGLRVEAVELVPEVVDASARFRAAIEPADGPGRLEIRVADARRHVRATDRRYDLVVADNVHPARSGTAALYTVEHFAAVRARLAPDGVFVQWLPLHQMGLDALRSVVRAYLDANPGEVWAVLATWSLQTPTLGLVARADGGLLSVDAIRTRLADPALRGAPAALGFVDELAVLGTVIAARPALERFAQGVAANTDDRPRVAHLAPREVYAPTGPAADRLLAVVDALSVDTARIVSDATPAWSVRLDGYRAARDRFLRAGREVRPSADPARMLDQVEAPLLDALRASADFRPAYDPLLRLAVAVAPRDPARARRLLQGLDALQPQRPEARHALLELPQ